MKSLLLRLSTLLGGVGLLVVAVGLLFSALGLRAGVAGFSSATLGLVTSAYFVGFVGGTYFCPALIRKVGHIRAFAALASVASSLPILHALWVDPWFWGLLRLVTGVCMVGLYIVLESWLNALAPNALRGRLFAVYMAVNFVGLAIGQWLILLSDRYDFIHFALVSILFSFALLPITLTPVSEPAPVDTPALNVMRLYRASPLGSVAAAVGGLLAGAFYGLSASYAQGLGLSAPEVATLVAATILGGALFQWPVGHYSDTRDRRVVLLWVCTLGAMLAAASYALPALGGTSRILLAVLLGGAMFAIYGLSVAHTNDEVDSTRLVEFTSGLLLIHGAGAALGPTIAGTVMDVAGSASLMLYFAVVLAALALYTIKRLNTLPPIPTEDKATFVAMGGGSQMVLHMDPRNQGEPGAADDSATPSPTSETPAPAAAAETKMPEEN
jgi:MFS family permease